ncbi:MAG: hypothetical protein GWP91_07540 [Rhodobacterales bacterium]|nr:hypothetical protein [Rhodobacterales bacterium]
MRILQIGDTHLGMRAHVTGAPRGQGRNIDHMAAFTTAIGPALQGEVDLVIHTGDLFDRSRPPRAAMLAAANRLVRLARQLPVLVIAGNHDRRGLKQYIPHRLPNLHIVDRPQQLTLGGLRIAAVPFIRRAEDWGRAAAETCRGGVDFLVAHQAFHGSQVPGLTFQVGHQHDTIGEQHLPPGVRWILSGHIHPRQAVRLGPATIVHGGSTERTAFSEAGQCKGSTLWDWGQAKPWRFVNGPTRPMLVVRSPSDLNRVRRGTWVSLPKDAAPSWHQSVLLAGGWIRARSLQAGANTHLVRTPLPMFQ